MPEEFGPDGALHKTTVNRRTLLGGAAAGTAALAAGMIDNIWPESAQAESRVTMATDFLFAIDFGSGPSSFFSEVSGLGSETEVVEFKDGTDKTGSTGQKVPGRLKYNDIVLKRGVTNSKELAQWRRMVEMGKLDAKDGSIVLMDSKSNALAKWNFTNAWPSKLSVEGPTETRDVGALEELTLVVQTVERDSKI